MPQKGSTIVFGVLRDRLVALLQEAAELEHFAACMYLTAAFSMKTLPAEGGCTYAQTELLRQWKGTMLSVARQEMEHLAIVNNLLTALGELAWFQRPPFPTKPRYYPVGGGFSLRPFSLEVLGDFLLIEFPDQSTTEEQSLVAYLQKSPLPVDKQLLQKIGDARKPEKRSLTVLYEEIEDLFTTLATADKNRLLVGPTELQISNTNVYPSFPPNPSSARIYDIEIATALDDDGAFDLTAISAAITQIRSEGEGGTGLNPPPGGYHFQRFTDMYMALSQATQAASTFVPGRAVVPNPVYPPPSEMKTEPPVAGTTEVTNPVAIESMKIFDLSYEVCLRLLCRIFSQDPGSDSSDALADAAFFPLMTLALRPMGDLLTQMPAFPTGSARAGPSYVVPRGVTLLPDPTTGWRVLAAQLDELRDRARALSNKAVPWPDIAVRLSFFADNMWRLAWNFRQKADLTDPT